jgi:hypothetical protein
MDRFSKGMMEAMAKRDDVRPVVIKPMVIFLLDIERIYTIVATRREIDTINLQSIVLPGNQRRIS